MRKALFLAGVLFLLAPIAVAQDQVSGTAQCGKLDIEHIVPVGDNPSHSYGLTQAKCTWPKPFMFGGVASKEGVGTAVQEANGGKVKGHGTYIDTAANGDKVHYNYQFSGTMKDGKMDITAHSWQIVGGTGKFEGAKGKGTCKVTPTADGGMTYECEGEYTLAKK